MFLNEFKALIASESALESSDYILSDHYIFGKSIVYLLKMTKIHLFQHLTIRQEVAGDIIFHWK